MDRLTPTLGILILPMRLNFACHTLNLHNYVIYKRWAFFLKGVSISENHNEPVNTKPGVYKLPGVSIRHPDPLTHGLSL